MLNSLLEHQLKDFLRDQLPKRNSCDCNASNVSHFDPHQYFFHAFSFNFPPSLESFSISNNKNFSIFSIASKIRPLRKSPSHSRPVSTPDPFPCSIAENFGRSDFFPSTQNPGPFFPQQTPMPNQRLCEYLIVLHQTTTYTMLFASSMLQKRQDKNFTYRRFQLILFRRSKKPFFSPIIGKAPSYSVHRYKVRKGRGEDATKDRSARQKLKQRTPRYYYSCFYSRHKRIHVSPRQTPLSHKRAQLSLFSP
jgi:hypothetical protein